MIDLLNVLCEKCNAGTYRENSLFDDLDGVLHCDNCNQEVKRYAPQALMVKQ